jgi:predicted glycosyltransferase
MKILIDIGHPAHVHLFKNFAWQMEKNGHEILFTVRDKEYEIYLLQNYGFKYRSFGKHYGSKLGKIWGLFKFNLTMFNTVLKYKTDILMGHGSIYAAHVSWFMNKRSILLEDTGNMEQVVLYKPFTDVILTPDVLQVNLGPKQIKYTGYHEFAYLLPKYFKPDPSVYTDLGIDREQSFILLRFVAWKASHDQGLAGISLENKIKAVNEFSKYGKVFISSEAKLPKVLEKYRLKTPPEKMHSVLYYADLVYGESTTIASECALLGTPAVFVNNVKAGVLRDQQQYGLIFQFDESAAGQENSLAKAIEILKTPELKEEWRLRCQRLLADKIDLTGFMIWFIEKYPESFEIMKKNPDYQYRFQ